ncbi:MAG: hypothetical protein ACFFE6_12310 [Candidatus Thorarchaeota archaeon]
MYQKGTDDEKHSFDLEENMGTQFVSEAKSMTGLVLKDAGMQMDRNILFKQQESLERALERVWSGVEEGRIEVECLPVLRLVRSISFPEISRKLRAPEIDHAKIIRELRLMVNTFQYVIKPKSSHYL